MKIPTSDKPYTRDELIAITINVLTDMNEETKLKLATCITDLIMIKEDARFK